MNTFIDTSENINGTKNSFVNIEYYPKTEEKIGSEGIDNFIPNQNFTLLNKKGVSETKVVPQKNCLEQDIDASYTKHRFSPGNNSLYIF